MPGTPRKTTSSRKAPPKAAEPVVEPQVDRFDLLSVLETDEQEPEPITFMGVDADIRRTFSGEEAVKFLSLIDAKDFEGVLTLIAGDTGPALWKKVGQLPSAPAAKVMNKLINMSTLHEGELIAPLPAFFAGMAGARPSQDSSSSTG